MQRKTIVIMLIGVMLATVGMARAQSCADPNLWEHGNWKSGEDSECFFNEGVSIEFNATYPKELADRSSFAKTVIFDYINEERRQFWKIGEWTTGPDDNGRSWIMRMTVKSELFEHSDTVASVLFESIYLEGQGRVFEMQTFTFDLQAEKVLTLEDIFVDGVNPYMSIAPFARAALQKTLEERWGESDWATDTVRVTVPVPENYAYWALTDQSLLIFFSGYDVIGSGVAIGMTQTAEIPLADLKDVLRPEFLPPLP